jgi:hypothetical protein
MRLSAPSPADFPAPGPANLTFSVDFLATNEYSITKGYKKLNFRGYYDK